MSLNKLQQATRDATTSTSGLPANGSEKARQRLLVLGAVLLLILGGAYLLRGSFCLFTNSADLGALWMQQQYVLRGKNPMDVIQRHRAEAAGKPIPQTGRDGAKDRDLGIPGGGYPPWAYCSNLLFVWSPSWALSRCLFGTLNLILLGCLTFWAHKLGETRGPPGGFFLAASFLAISSICSTFGLGQYGVVLLAALVGAVWLEQNNRPLLAGLLLGLALAKVTLAGPFLVPFVIKRKWKPVAVALLYCAVASVAVGIAVHTSPLEMLSQMTSTAETYALKGSSAVNLLVEVGVGTALALKLAAGLVLGTGAMLAYRYRSAPMLTQFAIAAMTARFWTYHKDYDNVVLIFLLIPATMQVLRRPNWLSILNYLLLGVSLWVPARVVNGYSLRLFQCIAWLLSFGVFVYWAENCRSNGQAAHQQADGGTFSEPLSSG